MMIQAQPQWIEKMYAGKVGRDHLGLGSVSSDQILPSLSPAINVLTYHPRYYSFYVFLLDEFWRRERPGNVNAWIQFYRPREFIFSLGAHLCEQAEHQEVGNVVGSRVTQGLSLQQQDTYDTTTNYIKSLQGGYGLYYRTVMAELELIYLSHLVNKPVDLPSDKGRQVAAQFREAVKNTAYYRNYFDHDVAEVPIEVIKEYIHQACLCQLQREDTLDHHLLLDVFLHGGNKENALARKETFRMFLDIARQTDGSPLYQDAFRQLIYFGEAGGGISYVPQEAISLTYRKWRLYQAREYYSFALNALWYYLCEWGLSENGDVRPIPMAHFWNHLADTLDFGSLAHMFQLQQPHLSAESGFTSLFDWLTNLMNTEVTHFDEACTLNVPIQEHILYQTIQNNRSNTPVMVAGMITMLALIYLRFGQAELWTKPEWEISKMGTNGRLSVHGFIQGLRRHLRSGPVTIFEIARWIYRDYIILQHQLIATSKLPENTFRFQREGNRLRFHHLSNRLEFMDSRYDALSTMVYELGLCGDFRQTQHPLTPSGEQLLNEGMCNG